MILLSGIFSWKTIFIIFGAVVLIVGICSGPKGKAKDDTKRYDKRPDVGNKYANDLLHAAKSADPNYAPKGSGCYKDKHGKVHYEGKRK